MNNRNQSYYMIRLYGGIWEPRRKITNLGKAMAELLGATTSALAGQEVGCAVQWPETSTWIDDGKGTLDLKFHGEDGEGLFDYTVQLAPEEDGSNDQGNGPRQAPLAEGPR